MDFKESSFQKAIEINQELSGQKLRSLILKYLGGYSTHHGNSNATLAWITSKSQNYYPEKSEDLKLCIPDTPFELSSKFEGIMLNNLIQGCSYIVHETLNEDLLMLKTTFRPTITGRYRCDKKYCN